MDIGYLMHGTPVAQKPQDEQADPTGLLRSLSGLCFGFMSTRDVVVEACVALPVLPPSHGKSLLISRWWRRGHLYSDHRTPVGTVWLSFNQPREVADRCLTQTSRVPAICP